MDKTYEIPSENLAKLELRINALARKAVKLGLPEPELEIVAERMVEIRDNLGATGSYRKVFDVSVTGESPKIQGWTLIAIIEHLPEGNVINKLPAWRDKSLPEHYRTADPDCKHCKLLRNRKLTFLVRKDNGHLMQVGSDCLKDFTGHKNPDALARWYTVLEDTMRDAESFEWGDISVNYLSLPGYLTLVSAIIDEFGWVSRGSAEEQGKLATADFALNPTLAEDVKPTDKHREESAATVAWVRDELAERDDLSDYEHSLVVIFGTDESTGNAFNIKHAGYVASAVNARQRHLADKALAENNNSEYQGEIGERMDLVLTVVKRLEYEGFHYLDTLHIMIMEDEDGNVYVWKTSAKKLAEGDIYKMRGTVKAHNEYKEIKQTILTRCTISCAICGGKIEVFYSEWAGGSLEACEKCYDEEIEKIKAQEAE